MSEIVASFNPNTSTSATFPAGQSSAQGALVFWNESNSGLILMFQDGSNMYLAPWYHRHKCGSFGGQRVTWSILATMASSGAPFSTVIVESFAQGEAHPGDGPISERLSNIGNTINTVGGTASSVQNDNNANGTSVVEATVAGDGSSAVSLLNNGSLSLGTLAHPGTFFLDGSSGNVTIDTTGKLIVDNRISANLLIAQTGNDLTLNAGTSHKLAIQAGGGDIVDINSSGLSLLSGTVTLLTGSFARMSIFTASVTTTSTDFAHGLGATPDVVLLQVQGGVSTIRTCVYDPNNTDATNVRLTGSGSFNVIGLALKK